MPIKIWIVNINYLFFLILLRMGQQSHFVKSYQKFGKDLGSFYNTFHGTTSDILCTRHLCDCDATLFSATNTVTPHPILLLRNLSDPTILSYFISFAPGRDVFLLFPLMLISGLSRLFSFFYQLYLFWGWKIQT